LDGDKVFYRIGLILFEQVYNVQKNEGININKTNIDFPSAIVLVNINRLRESSDLLSKRRFCQYGRHIGITNFGYILHLVFCHMC
jgi:hypothetical protein